MSNSRPLHQFLTDLALDPGQYATYVRQPAAAMQAAGLGATAQAALRRGRSAVVGEHLGAEAGATCQAAATPGMQLLLMLPEPRYTRLH
jgi:hypothetical protein